MDNFELIIPIEFLKPSREFELAMESIDLHWWYWDNKDKRIAISPGLAGLLDYDPTQEKVVTLKAIRNIHPDDVRANGRIFREYLEGKSPVYEMEFRLKVKGEWCWYYNRGTAIKKDNTGRPLMVGGVTMNISDRYSSMLNRIEEGRRFEFIFKNNREAIFVVRLGTKSQNAEIVEVNDAAAKLMECSKEDLVGMDPYKLLVGLSKEGGARLKERLLRHGKLRVDLQTKSLKGTPLFAEINTHLFNMGGEGLFVGIVSDKTENLRIKNELKASEKALKHSEDILRSLIHAADDRIGIFDIKGNIIVINDAFATTLGYTYDEFMDLKERERIHPEDSERLKKMEPILFQTGHLSTEYRAQHKDGHYLYMYSKSVLLSDPQSDKDYVLFIIRDITDRIVNQQEIIAAKEKAEESDKLKSAFLANMSHEIRTPMNSIVGFANLLGENDIDEEEKAEYINRINRNSEQLLALISDIVDLAKIESNQLSVRYTSVILDNLFNELATYTRQLLKDKNKQNINFIIDNEKSREILKVNTDLVRITQIMQNLINNAVKFTLEGEIKIGFRINPDRDQIRLFVKDTGVGIDKKYFEVIFDQFRQIDGSNVRQFPGTGLGLAICKNLAELLGGRIWVESEKARGSTFTVELPLSERALSVNKGIDEIQKSNGQKRKSVLMVDDDQDTLILMATLLRNEGLKVHTADSGYKALEILEREALPDLILMDLEMPVMNGWQTTNIIRENYPNATIVAQSAHALADDRRKSLEHGFDDYLTKPFSKQELMRIINNQEEQ